MAFIVGAMFLGGTLRQNRVVVSAIFLLLAWAMVGFSAASLRTQLISTPVLSAPSSVDLTGVVVDVQPLEMGSQRLLLQPTKISGLPQHNWPNLVRIKLRASQNVEGLRPGYVVSLSTRLMPLPPPVAPGGFDFGRSLFFKGVGATGFAYSPPQIESQQIQLSWGIVLNQLRGAIAARVFEQIEDKHQSAIAVALLTGYRGAIPEVETNALRGAGLAHLLAISGLHLGLVSGTVYFVLRLLFALFPRMALNYPVRKWAAGAALVTAVSYFLISGMSVPTMRAMVMTSVVLLAIILDRQPISMRLVAIAAIVVLLIAPESLVGAGFHMSFAAVMGLVATYEALRDRRGGLWRLLVRRDVAGYATGLITTSIVAGGATALIAAFHFNRFAQFGLLGNILAVPLTGFLIMPAGLLGLITMPFGLENVPLQIMALGIEGVLATAHVVSSLKGAEAIVPSGPPLVLVLLGLGGLLLLLLRGWVRSLGLLPMAAAIVLWGGAPKPDILIDRELKLVAVRNAQGQLVYSSGRSASFVRESWQRSDGVTSAHTSTAACDRYGCVFEDSWENRISYARTLAAAMDDCSSVDVLIVNEFVDRSQCAGALVIDQGLARRKGAMALYWDIGTRRYQLKQAAPAKDARRPWHSNGHSYKYPRAARQWQNQ